MSDAEDVSVLFVHGNETTGHRVARTPDEGSRERFESIGEDGSA